jgi:DNA sulfur modification protein DndD
MLFRRLTLTDFGTYAGVHTLELAPELDRPLVLIGGTNGAGKTTVLEALLLCLHGRRAIPGAVSLREYHAHVASRIHVPASGQSQPTGSRLELCLEHADGGELHEYVVERSWQRSRGGAIHETLRLARDGVVVDDLPESAWQDFLDGLVPPGIADLFLFDGERIQALADDETGDRLGEAVRRLLGLDIVGQLRSDLTRYIAKHEGDNGTLAIARVSDAQSRVSEALTAVVSLKTEREALDRRSHELSARASREREKFARQGGMLAVERSKLEADYQRAAVQASKSEAHVNELVTGLLPFAICRDIAERVGERIAAERDHDELEVVRARLALARRRLRRSLAAADGADVVATLERILLGSPRRTTAGAASRVHDLTPSERAVLADQLRQVLESIPPVAARVAKTLSKAEESRARTRELLDKVPELSDVSGLLVRLQEIERELGAVDFEAGQVDKTLQAAIYAHTVAERELRRATDELRQVDQLDDRVGQAVRATAVLEEFGRRIQTTKLGRIEVEAARFFNRLSRKGDLLSSVRIDADSFRVHLRRWDDTPLPKERLSAGEKQLLAIALLWALAKVSGRPLPVVIDTPLARLDREHRENLLREYLPHVSHQVIVLSTDTEVDAVAAAVLAPVTARAFHLEHDAATCSTAARSGYFFAASEAVSAR